MSDPEDTADTLREVDRRFDGAVSAGDAATLEALLADDYVYTHSTGQHQAKQEYIAGIVGRTNPSRRLLSEIEVEVHGDVAVTRGNLDIVASDGQVRRMRYVRVHRLQGGRWRPISNRTVHAVDRDPA